MNINKKVFAVPTLCGPMKKRIDTSPDYQRPLVWTLSQRQLLIDTLLRGFDVPKLYWRRVAVNPDRWEVVDGQQRLHAIWDFYADIYALAADAEPINGEKIAGLRYSELPDDVRSKLDEYSLDVMILEDTDEEDARELFQRLQNGTTLKAAEKRNAMSGSMRDLVHELAHHEFLGRCGFVNRRFDFDQVVAQMLLLEFAHGPCEIGDQELRRAYSDYADFDFERGQGRQTADRLRRVLGFLGRAFPEKTPELKKTSVVSLYLLVSTLLGTHAISGKEKALGEWFIGFERKRSEDDTKPQDERDPDIRTYHEHATRATNSQDSIAIRHEILARAFMLALPDLPRLDNQREFTFEQRLAIFRKHKGLCQYQLPGGTKCGTKCGWSDWHADHIMPWSKGGPTTVANGQVLCPKHNLAKGSGVPAGAPSSEPEAMLKMAESTAGHVPKTAPRVATGPGYSSILNRLCDLGWKPEQMAGQGRTVFRLDRDNSVLAILRHAMKQRKGRADFYFFGVTRAALEGLSSHAEVYLFFECGGPDQVLVLPAVRFCELVTGSPTVGKNQDWKINIFNDGTTWTIQPSGKPRIDITAYLNLYPRLT